MGRTDKFLWNHQTLNLINVSRRPPTVVQTISMALGCYANRKNNWTLSSATVEGVHSNHSMQAPLCSLPWKEKIEARLQVPFHVVQFAREWTRFAQLGIMIDEAWRTCLSGMSQAKLSWRDQKRVALVSCSETHDISVNFQKKKNDIWNWIFFFGEKEMITLLYKFRIGARPAAAWPRR